MLIDSIRKTYREITSHVELAQPVVTVPVIRLAANAGSFENSEMQARRHRRQRRLERMGQHSINGWKVRAW